MKIMMTDMEGVSGVRRMQDWCTPESRYYQNGCRLLTQEVNAAVDGFFSAGATYVQVADGHGAGGIDIGLLDRAWNTPGAGRMRGHLALQHLCGRGVGGPACQGVFGTCPSAAHAEFPIY